MAALALALALFDAAAAAAYDGRPVRSLLEIRRAHVMIQHWDLSCGAAALGTILHYQLGENISEKVIARALMRRGEYVRNPHLIQSREGFSLLDLKRYVQSFRVAPATRAPYVKFHNRRRTGSSSRHHTGARSVRFRNRTIGVFRGEGLGQLELDDLVSRAPLLVPIDANGYHHFVIFRGVLGNRVLLADPAWGNRTVTIDKFRQMWIDYGKPVGRVGFVVTRVDGRATPNKLEPTRQEFLTLQ